MCGESELPQDLKFDLGYFNKNKKLWINCSQDLCDAWSIVCKGGRLTFWCVGVGGDTGQGTQKKRGLILAALMLVMLPKRGKSLLKTKLSKLLK